MLPDLDADRGARCRSHGGSLTSTASFSPPTSSFLSPMPFLPLSYSSRDNPLMDKRKRACGIQLAVPSHCCPGAPVTAASGDRELEAKMAQNERSASKTLPSHNCYLVEGEGETAYWTRIGAAWSHPDGKGFNLALSALPITGRLVIRERSEEARK